MSGTPCLSGMRFRKSTFDEADTIMAMNPQQPYVAVEEYLQLDNESTDICYDYIDGRIIRCAGGSPQHAEIATNVISILRPFLRGGPCHLFSSDVRIRLSESRYVHPDIAVSCDERDWADPVAIRYPRLVIEVLSPSTELRDRGQKFAEYRACPSLQEYVLINFAYQEVELYRRKKSHLWSFQTFQPGAHVELTSLDVRFPVTDIYESVFFPGGNRDQSV